MRAEIQELDKKLIETAVDRVVFSMHLPEVIPFINGLLRSRSRDRIVGRISQEDTYDPLTGDKLASAERRAARLAG